ncbi:MAG TPA: hypothetical protein VEJ20_10425 [Candidatus Eremiobacteraceae bacterium]|nr:hypothetical protein [Candidatus Eremiobacteraceae bacterium]
MSDSLSFARDIRPMFTEMDVDHMQAFGMDLSSRDEVAEHADHIYEAVKGKTMPPPNVGEPQWTDEMCERFKSWQSQGCPP